MNQLGPFEAVGNYVRTPFDVNEGGGVIVAECPLQTGQAQELARLFAAAPDLLAALQECLRELPALHQNIGLALGENLNYHRQLEQADAIEARAKAAIANATGRPYSRFDGAPRHEGAATG